MNDPLPQDDLDASLEPIREMVQACIQCGTCSGSCPNEFAMDLTPRKMWRLVIMGQSEKIFASRTFTLCSACYTCSLRCPRGLPLTDAMAGLKRIAARENLTPYRRSTLFYKTFMESVRRHGRVREMEFMTRYFAAVRNPMTSFRFAPLGLKLMGKGKVEVHFGKSATTPLNALFDKVSAMEEGTREPQGKEAGE